MKQQNLWIFMTIWGLCLSSCSDPDEADRVELPVQVDATGITTVTNDLGYEVEVTQSRVALKELVFTVAGEIHTASLWHLMKEAILPTAHAHPGHYQGGEVTGELPGDFVIDWSAQDGRVLGTATLLTATYSAVNFTFGRGDADTLGEEDPLVGHTALFEGVATKDGESVAFTLVIDSPEDRQLVGAPFEAIITEATAGALHLCLDMRDALEGDTLFDGLDFAALDTDQDGILRIEADKPESEDAYNAFRRVFQTHNYYSMSHQE